MKNIRLDLCSFIQFWELLIVIGLNKMKFGIMKKYCQVAALLSSFKFKVC